MFAFGISSQPDIWAGEMTTTMVTDLISSAVDNDTESPYSTSPPEGDISNALDYRAWLMPVIFSILIVIGVVGNTLVIYVIIKASKRTVTNYYIVNLAVADILFLAFCAPPTAASFSATAFLFGRFMCKIVFYLQMVTAQSTCLLLTAMSVDRFQAIVRPLKSLRTRTLQTAIIISVSIWLFAFLLYIPLLIFFDIKYIDYYGVKPYCVEQWPSNTWSQGFVIVSFILVFSLPLIAIAICYSIMIRHLWQRVVPTDALSGPADEANQARNLRQKRKITWMVLTVVVVFAVCWFPIHILNMWHRLDPYFPYTEDTLNLKSAGHVLSYANSCANPFIYAFLGENFRKSFKKAFPCCFKKEGLKREGNSRGATTGSQHVSTREGTSTRAGASVTQMSIINSRTDARP